MSQEQQQEDPLVRFNRHVDLLLKCAKIIPSTEEPPVGIKNEDLPAQLQLAGERLLLDAAQEVSTTGVDAIALTLLSIYHDGLYDGGFISKPLDDLAQILLKARRTISDTTADAKVQ